jgi:hypothetical protein
VLVTVGYKYTIARTMSKKSKYKRRPARANGMLQISVSLPESLVAKLDALAKAEKLNRTKFIARVMTCLVEYRK